MSETIFLNNPGVCEAICLNTYLYITGVFLFEPPWPNNMLGEKHDWGIKKGGKILISSQLVKSMYAYFPKLQKKG